MTRGESLLVLFAHLRLHYQLVFLAPLFLWGVVLGSRPLSLRTWIGFVAFHVFLYGGITAYNSYYDRDEGPVGGLRVPPPVTPGLLAFSLSVQAIGLGMAVYVGPLFALVYLGIAVLSVVYSHPRLRWKAKPVHALFVVAFGQGAAGFLAGLLATGSDWSSMTSPRVVAGGLSATLSAVGLYPLTQLYQIEEDRARGDRTFAVAFGVNASFVFSLICLGAAGACMVLLLGTFGVVDALLAALGFLVLLGAIARWRVRFRPDVYRNFQTLHVIQLGVSLIALGYVGVRLLRV